MATTERHREVDKTHDVPLVELVLEVVDDVKAGGEVGWHEDVGPVPHPPRGESARTGTEGRW
jgi:hypothetical protein